MSSAACGMLCEMERGGVRAMHHPLYLLALLPAGALLWWCSVSLKEIRQAERECARFLACLEAAQSWLRDGGGEGDDAD